MIKAFCLSNQSIIKIAQNFPKVRKEVIKLISDMMDKRLYEERRLPGQSKEYLATTGLCGMISNQVMKLLIDFYPDIKLRSGFYRLDYHPRFKDQKIYSLHYWLEIDNKILDLTANQFNPFINQKIDEVEIIPVNSTNRYMQYNKEYQDVGLDDDFILNWYIENI